MVREAVRRGAHPSPLQGGVTSVGIAGVQLDFVGRIRREEAKNVVVDRFR
jgi:hypothetical protein